MDPTIRKLLTAGQAEIIRSSQKDSEFIKHLNSDLQEVIHSIFGQRVSQSWNNVCLRLSTLAYHSLTNLCGLQTLGEEYCGILQVDELGSQIPGKIRVGSMIFFETFGYSTVKFVSNLLEKYLSKSSTSSNSVAGHMQIDIQPKNKDWSSFLETGNELLQVFKHYLPFFIQLHLALFYFQGTFYHFSKRVLGIHYLLVRKSFANQDDSSRRTLKYLMVISLVNSFLTCINDSISFFKSKKTKLEAESSLNNVRQVKPSSESETEIDISKRCTLCLEKRTYSSVTPCGHLFCWECIIDWTRSKQECPICRDPLPTNRIVPLQNYI